MWKAALLVLLAVTGPAFAQTTPPVATPPPPLSVLNDAGTITVRELAAVIAERDRQYAQRFEAQQKAVDAALAAQDKATAAAFSAAEKAVAAALAAQEKATAAAFAAANTAVIKSETANDKRLEGVNEFRAQLKDQAATLATRSEVSVQFKALEEKVGLIQQNIIATDARGVGANNLWILILGGLGLVVVGVGIFLRSSPATREGARYLVSRRVSDAPVTPGD